MWTIWKFPLESSECQEIETPPGEILTVQMQGEQPCLWVLVDPDGGQQTRRIRIYETGQPIEAPLSNYIDTFQLLGSSLVFHVFEDLPKEQKS